MSFKVILQVTFSINHNILSKLPFMNASATWILYFVSMEEHCVSCLAKRCIFNKREDVSVVKGLLSELFRYRYQPSRGGGGSGVGILPSSDLAAMQKFLLTLQSSWIFASICACAD